MLPETWLNSGCLSNQSNRHSTEKTLKPKKHKPWTMRPNGIMGDVDFHKFIEYL